MDIDFSRDIIEKLLFKQILVDKQYMNVICQNFDKRWIKTNNLSFLFNVATSFFKKYGKIPDAKLLKALVKRYVEVKNDPSMSLTEINDLIDESLSLEFNVDKEILENNFCQFIRKQAVYTSIMDNIDDIEKNSENVLEKCLARFDEINKISFGIKDLGMDYFDLDDMAKHWEFISNPAARIPTLWPGFDEYTNGGLFKDGRMLLLFMGQAGLGKSLFLSNLAVNLLKQNLSVVVISLEMSQDVYAQRFDAHISKDDINHLKDTMFSSCDKIKAFYKQYPKANLFIKEYPPRSIKTRDIEIYLENLKLAGKNFDAVIVDYLNLVIPNHRSDSMYKDGLAVSEELRALSYKFSCPVISAVQSNTEGMNNENIDMQNISESRGIAHTCDALFALFQMQEDRENGIINMRVLKNRLGGRVGKVLQYSMNPSNLTVIDLSEDRTIVSDLVKSASEEKSEQRIVEAMHAANELSAL